MNLNLMCIFAHPDDETLAAGPTLLSYAKQGINLSLICATRGEKGWKLGNYPGTDAVAKYRTKELKAAAECLGIRHLRLLDYPDGRLDQANPQSIQQEISDEIKTLKPDVVISFAPDGAYGHPDHIAISQFATAAIMQAAQEGYCVQKFYYFAETKSISKRYMDIFGDLKSTVDGVERRFTGWDDWAVSSKIDTSKSLNKLKDAIYCHRSQLRNYESLLELDEGTWHELFGQQTYYRVFSLINGGRKIETDLFAGLR